MEIEAERPYSSLREAKSQTCFGSPPGSARGGKAGEYVRTSDLDHLRVVADVGADTRQGPSSTTLYCKKVPIQFRHPDFSSDITRFVTLRMFINPAEDVSQPDQLQETRLVTRSSWSQRQSTVYSAMAQRQVEMLCVDIYDDTDPFNLLQFRLSRSEFAQLRDEQRLLVDFSAFPGMLVQLLERCRSFDCSEQRYYHDNPSAYVQDRKPTSSSAELLQKNNLLTRPPSEPANKSEKILEATGQNISLVPPPNALLAFLVCELPAASSCPVVNDRAYEKSSFKSYRQPASATFSLVETNDFKELTHIFLRFIPASPCESLRHLMGRVCHIKDYTVALEHELTRIQDYYQSLVTTRDKLHLRLKNVDERMSSFTSTLEKEYETRRAELEQEVAQKLEGQEKKFKEAFDTMERELKTELEQVTCAKLDLQARVRDMEHQLSVLATSEQTSERQKATLTETVSRLTEQLASETSQCQTLACAKRELEAECRSLCARLAADQADTLASREKLKRLESEHASLESLRERESELCLALQASAAEITKGNALIEKLQQALRRERAKSKQVRTATQQETQERKTVEETLKLLNQKESEYVRTKQALHQEVDQLRTQLTEAEQTIQHFTLKIEDLETQLAENTVEEVLRSTLPPTCLSSRFRSVTNPAHQAQNATGDASKKFSNLTLSSPDLRPLNSGVFSTTLPVFPLRSTLSSGNPALRSDPPAAYHCDAALSDVMPQPPPKPTRLSEDATSVSASAGGEDKTERPPKPHDPPYVKPVSHPSPRRSPPTLLNRPSTTASCSEPLRPKNRLKPPLCTARSLESEMSFGKPSKDFIIPAEHSTFDTLQTASSSRSSSAENESSLGFSMSTYDSSYAPHFGLQSPHAITNTAVPL